jgi:N6-L-threonylcarbamoyladenine synthase
LLRDDREVVASVVASQVDMHRAYGGVVPEIAFRKHVELINPVIAQALDEGHVTFADIGAVAVSNGPGLVGALLVGVAAAKVVAGLLGVPLLGVNHLEAHIYANFLQHDDIEFPLVCLLVSGGHTILYHMPSHGVYEVLGETRDDAAGEAFDKVGRLLGLDYPAGPIIDRLAREGNPAAVTFPRAWLGDDSLDFSFSGLKTAVLHFVQKAWPEGVRAEPTPQPPRLEDVCAGFQDAVVDVLVGKTMRAARRQGVRQVMMAGGVAANGRLRERMQAACEQEGLRLRYPNPRLCTDNAMMVACAGYHQLQAGRQSTLELDCYPVLPPGTG